MDMLSECRVCLRGGHLCLRTKSNGIYNQHAQIDIIFRSCTSQQWTAEIWGVTGTSLSGSKFKIPQFSVKNTYYCAQLGLTVGTRFALVTKDMCIVATVCTVINHFQEKNLHSVKHRLHKRSARVPTETSGLPSLLSFTLTLSPTWISLLHTVDKQASYDIYSGGNRRAASAYGCRKKHKPYLELNGRKWACN